MKIGPGRKGIEHGHSPHIVDAMEIINKSWSLLGKEMIRNCWRSCGLRKTDNPNIINDDIPPTGPILDKDITKLLENLQNFEFDSNTVENELDEMLVELHEAIKETAGEGSNLEKNCNLDLAMQDWLEIEETQDVVELGQQEIEEVIEQEVFSNQTEKI